MPSGLEALLFSLERVLALVPTAGCVAPLTGSAHASADTHEALHANSANHSKPAAKTPHFDGRSG